MSGAVQRMRATLRAAGISNSAVAATQRAYEHALANGETFAWRQFYCTVYAALRTTGARSRSPREQRAFDRLHDLLDDDFGVTLFKYELHELANA